ncbi:MAG: glycosyltransferase family 2 protein [Verrucomicrobia bacterium]|nr:glycosyltransferase family 2 protein [Verrucomicrobiota bacterium]MCH8527239.1 glycosyltransferase family 2 protein [Kiritimatiellia bacterium]
MRPCLIVVMPVYNEGAVIGTVVEDWLRVLDGLGVEYQFRVRNDGSRDDTGTRLEEIIHPALEVISTENRGHGPTLMAEYPRAFAEAEWVFQTDSDGEIPAEIFPTLWSAREGADFVIGARQNRGGPWSRRLMTRGLKGVLHLLFGPGVRDGNCPYRLMRSEAFSPAMRLIPEDTFAPNVLLSGYALRAGLRVCELPVPFIPRRTGTVSIRRWRLLRAAGVSAWQTVTFRSRLGKEDPD